MPLLGLSTSLLFVSIGVAFVGMSCNPNRVKMSVMNFDGSGFFRCVTNSFLLHNLHSHAVRTAFGSRMENLDVNLAEYLVFLAVLDTTDR
jgi:hypothetical protein